MRRVAVLLALLSASGAGAGKVATATPPAGAAPVVGASVARGPGIQRLESHAVADTPWTAQRPHPRARYGSFAKARDCMESMVRAVLGAYADSARWQRRDTSFVYRDRRVLHRPAKTPAYWTVEDRDAPVRVPALIMTLETALDGGPDMTGIAGALAAAGWAEDGVYSADGTDGSTMAYVCREALCVLQGSWDGGDPTDSTYVPAPGGTIELVCVPRVPASARRPGH